MKKRNIKMVRKIFKDTKKWANLKNDITPTKVFYIWDRENLTKIETFSV